MAYYVRYIAYWGSQSKHSGRLLIEEEGADFTSILKLKNNLSIKQNFIDWEHPILGSTLDFTIVNTFDNYFELMDLLTADERQFKISLRERISMGVEKHIFTGYLNSDANSEQYLHKADIQLTASSYLSKLKNYTSSMVNTIQNVLFINLIDDILRSIGTYNIRVSYTLLKAGGMPADNASWLNTTGISTEVFWEDNIKRKNNFEILEMILKSFNCFLYWRDGNWYIERFSKLWQFYDPANQGYLQYIEYNTGVTYTTAMSGTVVNGLRTPIKDIQSLTFMERSQVLHIDKGFKTIQLNINTDDHLFSNLVVTDMNPNSMSSVDDTPPPEPPERIWQKYQGFNWDLTAPSSFLDISSAIYILDAQNYTYHDYSRGLWTTFTAFIDNSDTHMTIRFSYGIVGSSLLVGNHKRSDWSFGFHWYLQYQTGGYFIKYNDTTNIWEAIQGTPATCFNQTVLTGNDFNKNNQTIPIEIDIPIGSIPIINTDSSFVLCIAKERQFAPDHQTEFDNICFGDIEVTVNNIPIDNQITGAINSRFLNKKELDIDICDVENTNYCNGILFTETIGSPINKRTTGWNIGDSNWFSLMDKLMSEKFKMYNVNRQRITARVRRINDIMEGLFIFDLFEDSAQNNKKFILTGYIFHPVLDEYEINLREFDTDTEIILI